jgi:threonine/homoserine/homoserine lactone efflux protein
MSLLSVVMSGVTLGLSISAPVGPMGVLCINRTLESGVLTGLSTGAGATTAQLFYCFVLISGLEKIMPWMSAHRVGLHLFGACLLIYFAWRLFHTKRNDLARPRISKRSLLMSYASALAFNLANPVSVALLLGGIATIFDPALGGASDGLFLLGGLFTGSIAWWIMLSSMTALARTRLSASMMTILDRCIGMILLGFSALSFSRAFGY